LALRRSVPSLEFEAIMDPRAVRTILVPTDFSEPSGEAVDTAIAFAQVFHARVELLHVFVDPTYALPPPIEMATLPIDVDTILDRISRSLEAEKQRVGVASVPITTVTRSGQAAPEIVAHAKEISADLIVMGTHGRGRLQHVLLGSVAERVVHHSSCPVLVVPVRKAAK
jgi:nucleotide-binding universal stress UspA family protein